MRYLRMLTNAVAGGLLAATYLVVLVLQLNPQVPLASMTTVRWFVALLAHYGPYLTAAMCVLFLVREALASRPLRPAWLSVRLLAWLGAIGAASAAGLTWANLQGFRAVLGIVAAEEMRQGAWVTTTVAVVLVGVALFHYSFGRRGSRYTAAVIFASLAASVAVPLGLRGPGDLPVPAVRRNVSAPAVPDNTPHVRLILLDGASLDFIRQRVAAGRLPHFGRLLDHGATIDLATIKPTQAIPVWAAAATGKYPPKNGVRSDAIYRVAADDEYPVTLLPDYCFAQSLIIQGFVHEESNLTSASLHARTIWDILADYGLPSGVVNMPLTRPAHALRGYVISDYFAQATSSPLRLEDRQSADPTTAVEVAREVFDGWQARPWTDALPALSPAEPEPTGSVQAKWDRAYSDAAAELDRELAPRLTAQRYEGLNTFGRWYLRDAEPELFGQLAHGDRDRSVLDRYYTYIDGEIGRAIDRLAPGDLLMVVSGFGMEDVPLSRRLLARVLARSNPSGGHERAPDGFLVAYGGNVAHGHFPRGSVVDLAPTVLYYLGLPVGRDMDGYARTDLFRPSYAVEHTLKIIGTYEIIRTDAK